MEQSITSRFERTTVALFDKAIFGRLSIVNDATFSFLGITKSSREITLSNKKSLPTTEISALCLKGHKKLQSKIRLLKKEEKLDMSVIHV